MQLGFISPCPSPGSKEELTGFGFSNNGGASFTDLGGLPNNNCATAFTRVTPVSRLGSFKDNTISISPVYSLPLLVD